MPVTTGREFLDDVHVVVMTASEVKVPPPPAGAPVKKPMGLAELLAGDDAVLGQGTTPPPRGGPSPGRGSAAFSSEKGIQPAVLIESRFTFRQTGDGARRYRGLLGP
jgi:hypothetical protein